MIYISVAICGFVVVYVYMQNRKEQYANQIVHAGVGGIAGPASLDSFTWNLDSKTRSVPIVSVSYPPNDTCRVSENIRLGTW